MRIFVLTLFPEMFTSVLAHSMLKRAIDKNLLDIRFYNIRDFAEGKHKMTDDVPYGGGGGMVMKPEPIFRAVEHIVAAHQLTSPVVVYLTPQGRTFNQQIARELALKQDLILLCGHYEEVDERVRMALVDQEISIGDYVLTGGELAAMVLIDVIARMIPGVVGNEQSITHDSFYQPLLDYPHYTRPQNFRGMQVPEVLISGNHKKIDEWRQQEAIQRTKQRRPDLLMTNDE
ncbi:tRNA (guanine-N(1)-)-methyltransferase [Candidatus Vecturithrix granuli]|uniref:tRNA (guanine-N(1)-)-methyltransferase n=1 Tax=Vecturithrix granuli TaxID=1499967 RepID=A0A081BUF0_VECG1|nr:tRNA (guanine-N(1)-)-methyltransferase [Candidatus Vecturithrix granuli]